VLNVTDDGDILADVELFAEVLFDELAISVEPPTESVVVEMTFTVVVGAVVVGGGAGVVVVVVVVVGLAVQI